MKESEGCVGAMYDPAGLMGRDGSTMDEGAITGVDDCRGEGLGR
jgi:hypothetical protein